jgi:hypothetical protein
VEQQHAVGRDRATNNKEVGVAAEQQQKQQPLVESSKKNKTKTKGRSDSQSTRACTYFVVCCFCESVFAVASMKQKI